MTERINQDVERLLNRAVDRSVPDLYQRTAETPVIPLLAADGIVPAPVMRRHRPFRALALGLCACAAVALGLGLFFVFSTAATVVIGVNATVELTVNRYERVLEARPRNEAGVTLLEHKDLRFVEVDTAVEILVDAMARQGYFLPGIDVVATVEVYGGSTEGNWELQEDIAEELSEAIASAGAIPWVNQSPPG